LDLSAGVTLGGAALASGISLLSGMSFCPAASAAGASAAGSTGTADWISLGAGAIGAAAERAIEIGAKTYGSVKSILDKKLDRRPRPKRAADSAPIQHQNIRGRATCGTASCSQGTPAGRSYKAQPGVVSAQQSVRPPLPRLILNCQFIVATALGTDGRRTPNFSESFRASAR
jgi:hypothetical protein